MNDFDSIDRELFQPTLMLPPDMSAIERTMNLLHATVFPDVQKTRASIAEIFRNVHNLLELAAVAHAHNAHIVNTFDAKETTHALLSALPHIQRMIHGDIEATLRGDPAARDGAEVIRYYPGLRAIFSHRIAHLLHGLKTPYVPRGIAEVTHAKTGIDIHPGAAIGKNFFIDHGTGVVIGETTTIGDDVKIYQGVTLGALSLPRDNSDKSTAVGKRHPTIQDRVTIYANATILGGQTVIGHDATISANAWIRESVPPHEKTGADQRKR